MIRWPWAGETAHAERASDQVAQGVFDAMNDAAARADALRLFARQHLIIMLALYVCATAAGAKNLALAVSG